jgi:flavin reductase (DIM6/NTAB) family NADH-FMN oxidoreductase RutF
MYYATDERDRTKLPRNPFKAIVAARPIGWSSTRALDGRVNLAPYSFFNGFSSLPPIVGFSSEGGKDSASFAKESRAVRGKFTHSIGSTDQASFCLVSGSD